MIDSSKIYLVHTSPLRFGIRGVLLLVGFQLAFFSTKAQDTLVKPIQTDTTVVTSTAVPDTLPFKTDSVLLKPLVTDTGKVHSVRKATLLSTYLPGAGQVYNRKAWKVPIIYAAFAGLAYLVKFNNDNFKKFDNALLKRYDNDPTTVDEYATIYSEDNLKSLSDFYRRNRDLSVIGITLVYVLNIIDAHVDAHLFQFNVDDDLSLQVNPSIQQHSFYTSAGLSLSLHF